ncbi:MAG: S8 family serine peptidase [Planctomycetota bacterium]
MPRTAAALVASLSVVGLGAHAWSADKGPAAASIEFSSIDGVRTTTDRLLLQLAPGVTPHDLARHGLVVLRDWPLVGLTNVKVPFGADPERLAATLLADRLADRVEMDYLVEPISSADPLAGSQWHLDRIDAASAWAFSTGSSDVTIAFVDSGVDIDHPDLAPLLVPGFNAPTNTPQSAGGLVQDLTGHGTATAGAATAIGNNGIGGSGVGWGFNVMPIRASNQTSGSAFVGDLINGILWALDQDADVISVSYAGVNQVFDIGQSAIDFYDALVVWGIDDAGVSQNFDLPGTIVVSGTDQSDALASFSSFGPGVDFAAPATQLLLAHSNGDYRTVSGNSYATPIVAAAAAMVRAINPELTAQQIRGLLTDAAEDIGPAGEDDQFGHGLIDVGAAASLAFESLGNDAQFIAPIPPIERLGEGLRTAYYTIDPATTEIPVFADLTTELPLFASTQIEFDTDVDGTFGNSGATENVGAFFAGFFDAPADRVYTFTLEADDGARLTVAGQVVAERNGLAAPGAEQGAIALGAGLHTMGIEFFSVGPRAALRVEVASPTDPAAVLDIETLRFIPATADLNVNGLIDLGDFSIFLALWSQADPAADFNVDGVVNLSDISVYLAAWALGI